MHTNQNLGFKLRIQKPYLYETFCYYLQDLPAGQRKPLE